MGDLTDGGWALLACGVEISRLGLSLKSGGGIGDVSVVDFAMPTAGVWYVALGEV